MNRDIINELADKDIYQYGSDELIKFEKQLTKYFTREYDRHKDSEKSAIELGKGPIALAPGELADDHYDEGIPFFRNFLDHETMSYTMAYYDNDPDIALSSKKSLDQAQTDKFELLATRINFQGSERLINFGCGFGYFESYLLENYPDLQISSLTHSKDQFEFVSHRMKDTNDPLSSDRFHLFFGEIDNNTSALIGKASYDVASSVGLMEQINNVELFYSIIDEVLDENGRMFHHLIVSRDLIPQLLDPDKTLIGDYFPGGKVLPYKALQKKFNHFELKDSWFMNGMNYWRTLDAWHENFWNNLDQIYPVMMDSDRIKYWNNYFVLCKAMFYPDNGLAYGNGQYLYVKKT